MIARVSNDRSAFDTASSGKVRSLTYSRVFSTAAQQPKFTVRIEAALFITYIFLDIFEPFDNLKFNRRIERFFLFIF